VVGRNGYAVEVEVVVGVGVGVGEGFDYTVELLTLADGGCPGCIASMRASLAPY
jgi:hypothetical protein